MTDANAREARSGRELVARAVIAAAAVAIYLLLRDGLSPRALVTARFGIGVAFFALLIDVGRALVGTRDPVTGDLAPHQQQATPRVDRRYERVHEPVERFIEEGVFSDRYERLLEEAFDAEQVPAFDRQSALATARRAARADRPAGPSIVGVLVAGLVTATGLSLAAGTALDAGGLPVFGPVAILAGLCLGLVQLRARDAGGRWWGLALGVLGTLAIAVGGLTMMTQATGPWWLALVLASLLLAGSTVLAFLDRPDPPRWSHLEERLTRRFARLRRAFLAVLLGGAVLFPFEPLLEELATALGWPFATPYRVATILYGTLAAYLAADMAATWYGFSTGRRRARAQRRRRVEANEAILDLLDEHAPTRSKQGGPA